MEKNIIQRIGNVILILIQSLVLGLLGVGFLIMSAYFLEGIGKVLMGLIDWYYNLPSVVSFVIIIGIGFFIRFLIEDKKRMQEKKEKI